MSGVPVDTVPYTKFKLEEGQDYYNEQAQLMGKILSLAKQLR